MRQNSALNSNKLNPDETKIIKHNTSQEASFIITEWKNSRQAQSGNCMTINLDSKIPFFA